MAFYNDLNAKEVNEIVSNNGAYMKEVFTYTNWMREKIKAYYDWKFPEKERKEKNWKQILGEKSVIGDMGIGKKIIVEIDKDEAAKPDKKKDRSKKKTLDSDTSNDAVDKTIPTSVARELHKEIHKNVKDNPDEPSVF